MSDAIAFHQEDGVVVLTCSSAHGIPAGGVMRVGRGDRSLLLTVLLVAIRQHGTEDERSAAARTCRAMLGAP